MANPVANTIDIAGTVSEHKAQNALGSASVKATLRDEQITEKSQEFESVFLSQMLEHMFSGIKTNELFGGGQAEDVYRSFMIDEYARLISRSGGIGVGDHVKREMIKMQETGGPS